VSVCLSISREGPELLVRAYDADCQGISVSGCPSVSRERPEQLASECDADSNHQL
jgi:hypothetical protein